MFDLSETRRLAGITSAQRMPPGGPLPNQVLRRPKATQVEEVAKLAVHETVPSSTRARAQYARALEEGTVRTFDSSIKMREGLEKARQLVQRALATVQSDSDRYNGNAGMVNEKSRAQMYRADQELVTAVESLYAAIEAVEAIDAAKRALDTDRRNERQSRRR
jgi:hypothetical protein